MLLSAVFYVMAGQGVIMQSYAPLAPTRPLPDARLSERLDFLIDTFAEQPQRSIPLVTGNRNDMDAAYNFFKNRRVSPAAIVAGCREDTLQRLGDCRRVLAVQDACDLNYSGLPQTAGLGHTDGAQTLGLKLHSTLAVRADGLPCGLLTQQIWARDGRTKGRVQQRRHRAPQDKESFRWQDHATAACAVVPPGITVIHVADREGDIYDWLAAPRPAHAHLLVRVAQPHRVVVHGPGRERGPLASVLREAAAVGQHTITVPRKDDLPSRAAVLTIRVAAVEVQPPKHSKRRRQLPAVPVWALEAWEENPPAGCPAVCWRLVTTEAVATWEEALRALREYLWRWLIERFHFVLKSGCQIEQLQLSDADRLANAVAVYSQVAVRVRRLTYRLRVEPEAAATEEFSGEELTVLAGSLQRQGKGKAPGPLRTLWEAVRALARLGGHLGRTGDGPPGVKVLWRGLQVLHDRLIGYQIHQDAPSPFNEDTRNA
jgi:hypothetical protein